jgi:hypothetical protein
MSGKHEYLAAKLARGGPQAPPKTRWWPRHWMMASKYVGLSCRSAVEAGAGRQRLMDGVREWENSIQGIGPTELINSHIATEAALIEAAGRNDSDAITRAGKELYANAAALAKMEALRITDLPEDRLRRLLGEHIVSLADLVRFRMDVDTAGCDQAGEKGRRNAVTLANFTAEWL